MISKALAWISILHLAVAPGTLAAPSSSRILHGTAIKNSSGTVNVPSSGTITIPAATDTLVGKATTDTLTNKTLTSPTINTPTISSATMSGPAVSDSITMTETTDPSSPASGKRAIYAKSDGLYQKDSSGNVTRVGSGSGGGVNFISQSTAWQVSSTDDRDLNSTVGNWLAFADAAASTPVDLTGGSPSVTCTRGTTDPLDGAGHLLVTKGASDEQGEGCSVVFNVQPAYQGSTATITASLNISSGSIVSGDVKLFVYNVTKSTLITPFNNDVLAGPTLTATFPLTAVDATPVNHQYRLGIYFASTSTTAVTLKLDNFSVSPGQAAYGLAGSNWTSYTPTYTSFSSSSSLYWRRVGDTMQIKGSAVFSGAASGNIKISLPSGYTLDTSKMTNSADYPLGWAVANDGAAGAYLGTAVRDGTSTTTITFTGDAGLFWQWNATQPFTWGANDFLTVELSVPISGWDSNVTMAASSQFRISSYLASGTRVTATPAKLGEYRTYTRSGGSSLTGSDNAPTAGPTVADGMLIYGKAYSSAATSGQTQRWEMYIGTNKTYRVLWYSGAGRTGWFDATPLEVSTTAVSGVTVNYDPTTGVIMLDTLWTNSGGDSQHYAGQSTATAGGAPSYVNSGYFDIVVSENAQMVGADRGTTSSINNSRIEWAKVSGSASNFNTTCSSSPCSIYEQSGAVSSVSQSGTGGYTVNWVAGTWSEAPTCTCTCHVPSTSFNWCVIDYSTATPSTSSTGVQCASTTGAGANGVFTLTCMGKR